MTREAAGPPENVAETVTAITGTFPEMNVTGDFWAVNALTGRP
jgi:hypothetical protein